MKKIVTILALAGLTLMGIAATAIPANAAFPTSGTVTRGEDTKLQQAIMDQTCLTKTEVRTIVNAQGLITVDDDYLINSLELNGASGSSVQHVTVTFPLQSCAGTISSDYTKGRWRDSYNDNHWNAWGDWFDQAYPCLEDDGSDCGPGMDAASMKSTSVRSAVEKAIAMRAARH
jgi:hypothetical protein